MKDSSREQLEECIGTKEPILLNDQCLTWLIKATTDQISGI